MRTSVFAIRAAALIITCAGATISTHASSSESDGPVIASKYNTVFKSPPRQVPSETAVDGPLLGNGSLLAVLAGGPERLRVHISNNDLWALKDYAGAPKPLAVLVLDIPSMKGASYRIEQQLGTAISHGTFVKDGVTLKVECAVAAAENLLWLRLESTGGTVIGQLSLALPTPSKSPGRDWEVGMPADRQSATSANADTTLMVSRFFGKDMRVKTGGACAARVLDGGTAFAVSPGKPVWITAVTTSLLQTQDPEQEALRLLAGMKLKTLDAVRGRHVAWWRNFWSKSFVEIADKFLEQRYYLSQYAMASASRDPEFPPGLYGWVTCDFSKWGATYVLNYNLFAPFYGLYAANHVEQADPCSRPFSHIAKRMNQDASIRTPDVKGIYQSRACAPLGSTSAAGRTFDGSIPNFFSKSAFHKGIKSPEQKTNGAYACVPLAMQWYATYDLAFAKRVYPYVKGVAEFWEHWLKFENGRYNDYFDPVHEESGNDMNPIHALGLVKMVMNLALDMSTELGVDADRHKKWEHIRDHLAPFPTQMSGDKTIFRYTEKGTPWYSSNTVGIQHVFPAGAIGLDSDPKLLEISRNTIAAMGRWSDYNGMNSIYAAAARVGYDPKIILAKLHDTQSTIGAANGMIRDNVHGMEHFSIVPNAIQEMLMQSYDGVIRLFPCWPKDQEARFGTLRARGAFLVSAELNDGVVCGVRILSEKGRSLTIVNPWPGKGLRVVRNGKVAEIAHTSAEASTTNRERFTLKTVPGESLVLKPE